MEKYVLVLNCGSSSIKFAIINAATGDSDVSGMAEKLGNEGPRLLIKTDTDKTETQLSAHCGHETALEVIGNYIQTLEAIASCIVAVGHRVVHGGEAFTSAVLVDNDVKQVISNTARMAPLHNPANLLGIESAQSAFPELPHIAVFDTAFFQTMPKHAFLYALPYSIYRDHGVRRYGFHGSSHQYVSLEAATILGKPPEKCNLITAHLGNGCSIAAIHQGKAVDTSLGFTPLEGLVMGTRCGDIDPSLPGWLSQELELSEEQLNDMLNKASGLLGLSQVSNDCRTLEELANDGNEQAQLALKIFCYRLAKYIGSYLVAAGPLDALIFTGGIGENSAFIRKTTIAHLNHMGFELDAEANIENRFGNNGFINTDNSQSIIVIATNEEWVIAKEAIGVVKETADIASHAKTGEH